MRFPIDEKKLKYVPHKEGHFGAYRKHDIHTGIDLYCKPGTEVFCIEDGKVVNIENFTGPTAGSPWWLDTKAVLVEGKHGVICYGEIDPLVNINDEVKEGDVLGKVLQVLKINKGKNPTSMLHLELYKHGTRNTVIWHHGSQQPEQLLNVQLFFLNDDWG